METGQVRPNDAKTGKNEENIRMKNRPKQDFAPGQTGKAVSNPDFFLANQIRLI